MDAKITKKRLTHLLSYDWLKIVGLALAVILVWSLIFTMTATRIRPSQQFTVFNHQANAALSDKFSDDYYRTLKKGVYSYEVIEANLNDIASTPDYASTLYEARLGTDEGDIIFVPNVSDPSSKQTIEGETTYKYSYVETFMRGYARYIYDVDKYLSGLEAYLNGFYDGGYQTGTINAQKVETAFRARAKANNDKRFKKEYEIKKGVADDIARIQKYRDGLMRLYELMGEGYIEYIPVTLTKEDYGIDLQGNFALNICPDESKVEKMRERVRYYKTVVENDKETQVLTSENMCVMFFNLPGVEDGFQYESVLYLVDFVESCFTENA